jgi:hypothetical protein
MLGDVQVSPSRDRWQGQGKVVSAVSASGPREGRGAEGGTGGSSGQAARRRGGEALGVLSARLTQKELAVVAASLRELAGRLDQFRGRLGELEAAAQPRSGRTSRSTRDSRSPKRSRSS